MDKKIALACAALALAALWAGLIYIGDQKSAQEQAIRTSILSQHNGTISGIVYEGDCLICTNHECEYLGEECWKANVTGNGTLVELALDRGGGVMDEKGGYSGPASPDAGPQQKPQETCVRQYTQSQDSFESTYTNTGCSNPLPTCSAANMCSVCSEQKDCLGTISTTYQGQADNAVLVITSTQYNGYYNYTTSRCRIDDSVIAIYDNVTDYATCYEVVASHVLCTESGLCDFI